jgi:hypothetical protein
MAKAKYTKKALKFYASLASRVWETKRGRVPVSQLPQLIGTFLTLNLPNLML